MARGSPTSWPLRAKSYGLFLATGRWVIYGILTCCHFYVVFKVPQPETESRVGTGAETGHSLLTPAATF